MGHPDDLETTIRGLKTSLALFAQPALARLVRRVVLPDGSVKSDDDLRNFVRNHCRTSYHPVGTCRMGSDDQSVVDTRLRLRGFEGLRICDSSVFPSLVGSNTNAPTAMLAEKASDLIAAAARSD
jgi:choline dehydrogenase-like flavoprotein